MRRRSGRRARRRFQQDGIRRYLLCLRNDASDTDSDSIPLSSLLEADTDAIEDSATLLTRMNSDMYSSTDAATDSLSEPRHKVVHRMSVLHSAMPLFTNHLQLPLFTGQRRWHTMFGQLNQLTPRGCAGTVAMNTDEDILADSNFASLFNSSAEQVNTEDACDLQAPYHNSHASFMTTQGCPTLEASSELSVMDLVESNFPALDENVDGAQSVMRHLTVNANASQLDDNANCESAASAADTLCGCVNQSAAQSSPGPLVGSLSTSSGSHSQRLHGRRHSDPGSIRSSTTGSLSTSSHSDNWYYYDCRLRPGGELAAQYGRLQTRRSLSVIVSPPAYDDTVYQAPGLATVVEPTTVPSSDELLIATESSGDNAMELPPPYNNLESELPPSYSEIIDADNDNAVSQASSICNEHSQLNCAQQSRASDDNVRVRPCSNSHRMFTGRPAVRWNRNTCIERWTSSSFNWVMS